MARFLGTSSLVVVCLLCFSGGAAATVSGALWSAPVPGSYGDLVSTAEGNLIAPGCVGISSGGSTLWTATAGANQCYTGIADAQGNVYIETADSSGNPVVESLDPTGNVRWSTPTASYDGYQVWRGIRPVIGANGSVYFALMRSSGISSVVLGFDEQTGAVTFNRPVNDATGLHASAGGLIIVDTDSVVDYVGYDGTLLDSYSTGPAISDYEAYSNAAGANGTVYLAGYQGSPGACTNSDVASVEEFTPAGRAWTWTDSSSYCSQTALAATPDGGVIFARDEPGNQAVFTSLSSTGADRWTHVDTDPNVETTVGVPIVDVNGTVALPSRDTQTCSNTGSGYCEAGRVDFVTQQADNPILPTLSIADDANGGYTLLGIAGDTNRLYAFGEDLAGSGVFGVSAFVADGFAEDYRVGLQQSLQASGGSSGGGGTSTGGVIGGGSTSGSTGGGNGGACKPPGARGQEISLTPANGVLPDGATVTFIARVAKHVVIPERGKLVTFKVDCGPNAGRTAPPVRVNMQGDAQFAYQDNGGSGTDAISASFTDAAGATERATASVVWSAPVNCGHITRNLGFFTALRCVAAKPMVQTVLQLGECTVNAAAFLAPPLKLARLLGLVAKARSLDDLVAASGVPRPLARFVLGIYHAYTDKLNPGARPGFQSFEQLKDTLGHIKDAAGFVKLLPNLWNAIANRYRSQIAHDVLDLTGLEPCVQLVSKVVR